MKSSESNRRARWLQDQVARWLSAGIISREQAEQILSDYAEGGNVREGRLRQLFAGALLALGVALLLAAAGSWLAARWDYLTNWHRLLLVLAGWTVVHAAGFLWSGWQRESTGRELGLLILSLFFPLLFGQIVVLWNMNISIKSVVFWWGVALIPIAWTRLGNLVGALYTLLICWWAFGIPLDRLFVASRASTWLETARFYGFLLLWLLAMVGHVERRNIASFALVGAIAYWLIASVHYWPPWDSLPVKTGLSPAQSVAHVGYVGAYLFALGLALPKFWRSQTFFAVWGVLLLGGSSIAIGSLVMYTNQGIFPTNVSPELASAAAWWGVLALTLAVVGAAVILFTAKWGAPGTEEFTRNRTWITFCQRLREASGPLLFMAAFLSLVVTDGIFRAFLSPVPDWLVVTEWLLGVTVGLAFCVFLLWKGFRFANWLYFEAGLLFFLIWLGIRVYDHFGLTLRHAALVFAGAGVFLGLISHWLRKKSATVFPQGAAAELTPLALPTPGTSRSREVPGGSERSLRTAVLASALWQGAVVLTFCGWYFVTILLGSQIFQIRVLPQIYGEQYDLFFGRSIRVRFPISEIDCEAIKQPDMAKLIAAVKGQSPSAPDCRKAMAELHDLSGKEVFITVETAEPGEIISAKAITFTPPTSGPYVRGFISGIEFDYDNADPDRVMIRGCKLHIDYGAEKIYVREHQLQHWKEEIVAGKVIVRVALSPWGYVHLLHPVLNPN